MSTETVETIETIKTFKETEEWCWKGVPFDFDTFCTYSTYKYKQHPINPKYASISTLDDLVSALTQKKICIDSPTSCYFNIDTTSGMFYRDQQDCIIWFLKDGKVVTNSGYFVAGSMPEFLSHIEDDSTKWYTLSKEWYKKLHK